MLPVGVRLSIPHTTQQQRQAIESRIRRLESVKREARQIFAEQERSLAGDYQLAKRMGDGVDAVGTVALILVDLTKLTKEAHRIMKLSDEAAQAASNTFVKEAFKDRAKNARDLGALVVSQAKDESTRRSRPRGASCRRFGSDRSPTPPAAAAGRAARCWRRGRPCRSCPCASASP